MGIQVVHFNPPYPAVRGPLGYLIRTPLNNFGDLLGPVLVRRLVNDLGLIEPDKNRRLVAVGSIMKLSKPGDTVWGAGVNGKSLDVGGGAELDVRAVRGPLTRRVLENAGATVPPIYGDPVLLWSRYWPRESYLAGASSRSHMVVIPNFNDFNKYASDHRVISPRLPYNDVLGSIARSSFVCGSSLHAIIVAESFGIPARLIQSRKEHAFKYDDYYQGTGRPDYSAAKDVEEATRMGGERPPEYDPDALLAAFPSDLWIRES